MRFTRGQGVTEQREPRYLLNTDRFELNLSRVREGDEGDYSCLVNNKVEDSDVLRLSVVGKNINYRPSLLSTLFTTAPTEPPSRPLVTGFTSRTISLSWSKPRPGKNNPGEIIGYMITVR